MPEFLKKAFITVVVFILAVMAFGLFTKKDYVECRSFINHRDFDFEKDSPDTYIPKVYEINDSCIAILKKKNKVQTPPPCTAIDHMFFNITLLELKAPDRVQYKKHLDKAQSAMRPYSYCRKQAEYSKWIDKYKNK